MRRVREAAGYLIETARVVEVLGEGSAEAIRVGSDVSEKIVSVEHLPPRSGAVQNTLEVGEDPPHLVVAKICRSSKIGAVAVRIYRRQPPDRVGHGNSVQDRGFVVLELNAGLRIGINLPNIAVQRIVAMAGEQRSGACLVRSWGSFLKKVPVGVVGIVDGAGFGVVGSSETRKRVVAKEALSGAILRHREQIIEGIVRIRRNVAEATGIFGNLVDTAKAVGRALALLTGLVRDSGDVSRVGGEHGIGGLRSWARATRGQRAVWRHDKAGPSEGIIEIRRCAVGGQGSGTVRVALLPNATEAVISRVRVVG